MSNRTAIKKPKSLRFANGVAVGLSAAAMLPLTSLAQAPAIATLPTVTVEDEAIDPNPNAEVGAPYKARTSADARHTRPLAETPQTIQVITKTAIDDSGQTDLKQILSAQPGITLGTGENGNAFGDRYIIRGQEARSDIFVDGLRDPGMTTRESFAIEQLEVTKGPNSSFAGRGSAGGAVNAVTKQPTMDYNFTRLSASLGSDKHRRFSMDANRSVGEDFALRANVLVSREDVPDREPSSRHRNGLALSGLWNLNSDLDLTLDYYGLRAKDKKPDLGHFLVGTPPDRKPARHVPVYAQDKDFLKSDVDSVTARVNYRFDADLKLTSLTRFGTAKNSYVNTGARSATAFDDAGNSYLTATIDNGHNGWQDVKYFAHQSNLRWDKELAGLKHEFIFSLEFTDHKVKSGNFGLTNSGAFNCRTSATAVANNARCLTDAAGNKVPNIEDLAGRTYTRRGWTRDWRVKTVALSAMDTVDLGDRWTAFGGLRVDHYRLTMPTRNNLTGVRTADYAFNDTLWNGHFGLTYKINPFGMVYASYGTAQDINGGEADTGTSSGYGGLVVHNGKAAGAKPETSENIELGTKWNLFDDKLLATAAMFQTIKRDVMEGADYDSEGTFNTGKNRVRGFEFGLVGNVTSRLQLEAGASFMKSRVLSSANPANKGRPLSNFADRSFMLQGKYKLTNDLALGAIARYESKRCGGQPDTGAGYNAAGLCSQPVPSFTVYDVFSTYRINKQADLRLNVLNVTDKDYYTAVYRSGSFLYKGDGRAVRLSLNIDL